LSKHARRDESKDGGKDGEGELFEDLFSPLNPAESEKKEDERLATVPASIFLFFLKTKMSIAWGRSLSRSASRPGAPENPATLPQALFLEDFVCEAAPPRQTAAHLDSIILEMLRGAGVQAQGANRVLAIAPGRLFEDVAVSLPPAAARG
jgi:hypothetical protein